MFQNITFYLRLIMAVGALFSPCYAQDRALMRMAAIMHYEDIAKIDGDEKRKLSAETMVTVLFRELASDFDPKNLNEYILVRVGDYFRTKTATPDKALLYYDELLGRKDQRYRFHALCGRAEVYEKSAEAEDIDKAIEDYTKIYDESQERPYREFVLFHKIELLMKKMEYAKADEWAQIYLDREKTGFVKYSAKVGLLLAESYDKQNRKDQATAEYEKIWSMHMGNIMVSAPAYTRWMELMWDRNRPAMPNQQADRQMARMQGIGYIQLTSSFKDKLTKEELEVWEGVEKLVKTHEGGPDMKDVRKKVD